MPLKSISLLVLLFLSTIYAGAQQLSISGKVKDENNQPLPGTTIFIASSQYAISADVNGDYILKNIAPGSYQLVFKMVGYTPFVKNIKLLDKNATINAVLKPSTVQLKSVTVKPNSEWFKNFEIFKKAFLGETANAAKCKILNAEILDLRKNKSNGKLEATAQDFLIIHNQALGYKIRYLLTDF